MDETRALAAELAKPAETVAVAYNGWQGPSLTTETRRYLTKDGHIKEKVIESGTGRILRDDTLVDDPLARHADLKSTRPAPATTVTKGRTAPKTS
jgi:hypothetical protein